MCGSEVVTHLGNSDFVCGTGDSEIEAQGKVEGTNTRCNRAFKVIHPVHQLEANTRHRKEIGKLLDEFRVTDNQPNLEPA